eukprot:c3515_g1_i1 orf=624-1097(+)
MDEPLLGPNTKFSFNFNPALFHIPEHATAEVAEVCHSSPLLCEKHSSLKDILIFGSPESSPRFPSILVNGVRPSDGRNNEGLEQLLNKSRNRFSHSYHSLINRDLDGLQNRVETARWHDDSFVHYGNNWQPARTSKDLCLRPTDHCKLFASSGKDLE